MTTTQYQKLNLGSDSSGRPLIINRRTAAMLKIAEERLGGKRLTIVQGSYVPPGQGAAASALTHAGGGVIDLRTRDLMQSHLTVPQVLTALRRSGFAAWYRTPAQGFPDPHIHAVSIGDQDLHPQAKAQVTQYRAGLNGLANHGRDDGPRVKIRPWGEIRRRWAVKQAERELADWLRTH